MPPLTDKAASFARTETEEGTVGQLKPTLEGLQAPLSPAVGAVAKAIFEADATINGFKFSWDEAGGYRRFCYRLRAKAAIAALSRPMDESRRECLSSVDAVADAWASIDGKLDEYRAGEHAESIMDEPGGHFSGYQEDAKELVKRIEKRGFKLVPIDAALGNPPVAR